MTDSNDALRERYFSEKLAVFEEGCLEQKSPIACFSLGEWYQVVKKDYATASKMFDQTCAEHSEKNACFHLGVLFLSKEKVMDYRESVDKEIANSESSKQAAKKLMRKACDGGNVQGCKTLARLSSPFEAKSIYTKLCLKPSNPLEADPSSCFRLGALAMKSGGDESPLQPLERGCELGHPTCCHSLAVMYKKGEHGVDVSDEKFERYRQETVRLVNEQGTLKGREKPLRY